MTIDRKNFHSKRYLVNYPQFNYVNNIARIWVSIAPGHFLYEMGCQRVLVHRDIQALACVRSSVFKLMSGILAFIVLRRLHEAIRLNS